MLSPYCAFPNRCHSCTYQPPGDREGIEPFDERVTVTRCQAREISAKAPDLAERELDDRWVNRGNGWLT